MRRQQIVNQCADARITQIFLQRLARACADHKHMPHRLITHPHHGQRKMQQRFGFDPIAQGKLTAVVILFIAGVGAAVSIAALMNGELRFSRLLSALVAIALIAEQIHRLTLLAAAKPAPSILGTIVRPFMHSILNAPPPQPIFEGEHRNAPLPDVWEE